MDIRRLVIVGISVYEEDLVQFKPHLNFIEVKNRNRVRVTHHTMEKLASLRKWAKSSMQLSGTILTILWWLIFINSF